MNRNVCVLLASASIVLPATTQAANYADSIVSYSPGIGFATDFSSGRGFTNATVALGQPSLTTPGSFGGPVDPFNPPYLLEQVVSIGAGGSLTVQFASPIRDSPDHRFGIDFMIYGNSGFVITNGNYSGGGITDGSLFGANPGTTRVSVSADNINYFQLDPARAPVTDTLFPTDGAGSFDLAVDPSLTNGRFAGLDMAGIRSLYDGSAGGAGFDLAWALDANGHAVTPPEVRFVRVEVLDGAAEIDGFAAPGAVPEPAPWSLLGFSAGVFLLLGPKFRREIKPMAVTRP